MKLRRETILILSLILVLALVTGLGALFQAQQTANPSLSSSSNAPDGARALSLWLSAAGYQVEDQPGDQFAIPAGTAAVLILQPSVNISDAEWNVLAGWVRQGGVLLLAANQWSTAFSGNPFNVTASDTPLSEYDLLPPAPIFRTPPLAQPAHLLIDSVLDYSGSGGLAFLAIPPGPVAWQIHLGQGQLLVFADASFLSNAGLKTTGNAQLALNLFSQVPQGSKVYFDEWHHGDRVNNPLGVGPEAWLMQTPAGFAVLFAAALIFIGLVLAGRPFGTRLPLSKAQTRRGSLDFVNALANLNRRAGHRQAVMEYYDSELKRAYGKRYRLDVDLPDGEFIEQLLQVNPGLESAGFIELMSRLRRQKFSENEMVHLARECAEWMEKLNLDGR